MQSGENTNWASLYIKCAGGTDCQVYNSSAASGISFIHDRKSNDRLLPELFEIVYSFVQPQIMWARTWDQTSPTNRTCNVT